jgi:hypothetical protein
VIRCAFSRVAGAVLVEQPAHCRPSNALGRYQSFAAAVESGQRFDVVEFLDLPIRFDPRVAIKQLAPSKQLLSSERRWSMLCA